MLRERILKVVLVLLGLFFTAGIYPIAMTLWHPDPSEDKGDFMMLSLYVTLGIFLLIAARNRPSTAASSLSLRGPVSLTPWSMGTMAFQFPNERVGFLVGSAALSSDVRRNLRIRAERPGPFRLSVPNANRHNLFRRFSRFDPFLDCLDRI